VRAPIAVRVFASSHACINPVAECLGYLSYEQVRSIVLEMYELDMKVDERIPNFLLKNVDLTFNERKLRSLSPYFTVEHFAAFCQKYPEMIDPAFVIQDQARQWLIEALVVCGERLVLFSDVM
jgi:hypothetical protein